MKALRLFVVVVAMFLTIEGCGGGGGGSSTEGSSSPPTVASTGHVSVSSSFRNPQNETGQENAVSQPVTVPEPVGLLLLGLGLMGLAGMRRKAKK